jgi:hypothetical protein
MKYEHGESKVAECHLNSERAGLDSCTDWYVCGFPVLPDEYWGNRYTLK